MPHTARHHESLTRRKIDNAIFQIDEKIPIKDEKEFIDIFMLVPMIFALNHCKPNDRVVHVAKRLVIPFVCASISQPLNIDNLERPV